MQDHDEKSKQALRARVLESTPAEVWVLAGMEAGYKLERLVELVAKAQGWS